MMEKKPTNEEELACREETIKHIKWTLSDIDEKEFEIKNIDKDIQQSNILFAKRCIIKDEIITLEKKLKDLAKQADMFGVNSIILDEINKYFNREEE